MFFWRTNFTPDWRIWVYKHLSWSSWLASLFGPRCTVFFVIYERLLRILVEADQILRFLSVILFNIHTPLTYPHRNTMGHHGYMFTIPPRKRCIFELGSGDRDLGSESQLFDPSGRNAERNAKAMRWLKKWRVTTCIVWLTPFLWWCSWQNPWRNFQRW